MTTAKRKAAIRAKGGTAATAWMVLDDTGRILAVADPPYHCGDGEVELPLPAASEGSNLRDWVRRDDAWVREPEPTEVPTEACFRPEEIVELLLSIQELCMTISLQLEALIQQGKGGDSHGP